jgi:uncharacterized membrane protein YgcG
VLNGDVFAVLFNQPVVVEQIGYGWYDGRTGQEVGVQFRDVGSSGKYFSWRLDRADYNLTYVIVKNPNSDVRKIFRWRFVKLSPETQAAMAAQFSDIFAKQYAGQYAQQYANQYAQQYAQQYAGQYAQQIQQQLQNYIDQVIQQQLGSGVSINSNPGSRDGGGSTAGTGSSGSGGGGGGGGGTPVYVEKSGYIEAVVTDYVGGEGRTDYFFATVDGERYRLDWSGATLYLCEPFYMYVGSGKLVIAKGYLTPDTVPLLRATEIRDPAYPGCFATTQPPPPTTPPPTPPPTTTWPPPTFTTTTWVQPPPTTQPPPPPSTAGTTTACVRTITCVLRQDGALICPQLALPPDCEVVTVINGATTTRSVTTTATPFQSTTSGVKQPQPTTPDAGVGGGNNNDDSPPWDWCISCTGAANSGGGTTVQRGDVAYGQPRNFNNVPNTITATSDGDTITVIKTYDNGDVQITTYGSSSSSSDASGSSGSSSGGDTNRISGVAGNCVNNMCPE